MMGAHQQYQPAPVSPTFDPEAYIHELLGFVRLYAKMAQDCLDANDAACFNHAVAHLTARVRTIVQLMTPVQHDAELESGH